MWCTMRKGKKNGFSRQAKGKGYNWTTTADAHLHRRFVTADRDLVVLRRRVAGVRGLVLLFVGRRNEGPELIALLRRVITATATATTATAARAGVAVRRAHPDGHRKVAFGLHRADVPNQHITFDEELVGGKQG